MFGLFFLLGALRPHKSGSGTETADLVTTYLVCAACLVNNVFSLPNRGCVPVICAGTKHGMKRRRARFSGLTVIPIPQIRIPTGFEPEYAPTCASPKSTCRRRIGNGRLRRFRGGGARVES